MKLNRIIFISIIGIYFFLLLFGAISILKPGWLITLSEPGRATEAKTHISRANEFMYQGNYSQALVLYREALKIDSSNRNTYGNMANALIKLGQNQRADKCLDEVLKRSENLDRLAFFNYYISRGDLEKAVGNEEIKHNRMGDPYLESALRYYEQAIEIMPYEVNLYYKHAHLAKQMGKDSIAVEGFREGIHKNESLDIFYFGALYSEYLISVSNSDTTVASDIIRILKRNDAIPWQKYDTISLMDYRQQDAYLALAYANLGELMLKAEDASSAESAFNKAIQLNPALTKMIDLIHQKH